MTASPTPSSPSGAPERKASAGAAGGSAARGAPSPAPPPVDRRLRTDRRAVPDRRQRDVPVAVDRRSGVDRRLQPDRRTDPAKSAGGYDLDADTLEFIHAVNRFKAETGRPFPTWSEILGILRGLGYSKDSARGARNPE